MSKSLIIAEKPSVANDIQRVLGQQQGMSKFKKEGDYFENDTHLISSAIGHLVELGMPNTPEGKKPKWDFASLPIIPDEFPLEPVEKTKSRLNLLKRLMKRKDVDLIINACDAGREGELIFRYIMRVTGVTKPTMRLWMQSMTNQAITDAFKRLRSDDEMLALADAATCRSESDWLLGINGTRALTAFNSRAGGFRKTPVGRVQTPTLTIVVEREKIISAFEPRDYWEVVGTFSVAAGTYRGRWFDPAFKKAEDDPHARPERVWEQAIAEAVRDRCLGQPATVEEKTRPTKTGAPLLYDLTSLQREANGRFGFSARRTLQIAQSLYEGSKALTYPRTDSRYLPEDYISTVKKTLSDLGGLRGPQLAAFPPDLVPHAAEAVNVHGVVPNKRIFNSAKVSDHFAIIPTGQIPKSLDEAAAKLYKLVVQRFIAVFFPPAEFSVTKRITTIGEDKFRSDGKVMVKPGWLAVYGKDAASEAAKDEAGGKALVAVAEGEKPTTDNVEVTENQTKPPPHYNEATLLSAMEGAGKLVEDEELAEAMSERGLGTPATRASIIEGLIFEKYISRDGKDLLATQKGIGLVDQIHEIGVDSFSSPEMTGSWEFKLKEIEHGKLTRDQFMREIKDLTAEVVDRTRKHADEVKERVYPPVETNCPACGHRPLRQTDAYFDCANPECKFRIYKNIGGRELTTEEAKTLFSTKIVGPLSGFRSRRGTDFEAAVELTQDEKGKFKTGFVFDDQEDESAIISNLSEADILCPYQGGKIVETENSYALLKDGATSFDKKVKLPKNLCKREIPREQAIKFFTDGKTDVIENFTSKKGRPFSAALAFDPDGKRTIQWQFPPRPAKKKAATKKKVASK
ncbi:DNA topoisomerase III [soil metagenome]